MRIRDWSSDVCSAVLVCGERRLVESGHVAEAARTGPRIVADAPRRPQVGARPPTAPEGRRSGAVGGVAPTYFCFQLPPDWYHQPDFALAIHCFANTSRICDSHSGCLLATAISRYTARASRFWSATALLPATRSDSAIFEASRTAPSPLPVKPRAPESTCARSELSTDRKSTRLNSSH